VSDGEVHYDRAGAGHARQRRTDPRIAGQVHAALGTACTVVNVGAGAASYEPDDRYVIAVEPSAVMRAQRPAHRPAVHGTAERLPLDDNCVDAAMATLTIHQWRDKAAGLREMRRVSRGPVVILTFDGVQLRRFWLADYLPELIAAEAARYPDLAEIRHILGGTSRVEQVPVPVDCVDGFVGAFYGRPERLLDPEVRAAQSSWGFGPAERTGAGLAQLERDLRSGVWDRRHGALRSQPSCDVAVRLIVAIPDDSAPAAGSADSWLR
jgi:SAM-dependent methyltransferase